MQFSEKKYFISNVQKENINDEYIAWLNDKEVNKFLEMCEKEKTDVNLAIPIPLEIKNKETPTS